MCSDSLCVLTRVGITLGAQALSFQSYPYLPLGLILCIVPLYYAAIRQALYPHCHIANYISSVGVVNIIGGLGCLLAALLWARHHNYWWGEDTKVAFKGALLTPHDPYVSACQVGPSYVQDGLASVLLRQPLPLPLQFSAAVAVAIAVAAVVPLALSSFSPRVNGSLA
eukprot:COSAG05_NODE_644_length_8127_cov_102.893373_4_plen_168_part_00